MAAGLPLPSLSRGRFVCEPESGDAQEASEEGVIERCNTASRAGDDGCVFAWTDEALLDACGVRIAFTERTGGMSKRPYNTLNLKVPGYSDTAQEQASPDPWVVHNRRRMTRALGCAGFPIICPNQVHKDAIVTLAGSMEADIARAMGQAAVGADAVLVDTAGVAALLCFADCVPLIFVAPGGAFAVVHCGWRGVVAHLAPKAFSALVERAGCHADQVNIYVGPYIHSECFEVGEETARIFETAFGTDVLQDAPGHTRDKYLVDLGRALRSDLYEVGAADERIADMGICTYCHTEAFFSFRASNGQTGRHGAFAVRIPY